MPDMTPPQPASIEGCCSSCKRSSTAPDNVLLYGVPGKELKLCDDCIEKLMAAWRKEEERLILAFAEESNR